MGYVRHRNATWDGELNRFPKLNTLILGAFPAARADEVKEAFKLSYARYRDDAFPNDELKPLSNTSQNKYVTLIVSITRS
jgi:hypothetical protein